MKNRQLIVKTLKNSQFLPSAHKAVKNPSSECVHKKKRKRNFGKKILDSKLKSHDKKYSYAAYFVHKKK